MKKIFCFQFLHLFSSGYAYAESNDFFSLRTIFQTISDTLSKIFNYLLDFNLYPIFMVIVVLLISLFIIFFWPWMIIKKFFQDLNSWKKYHIGQKIMHPIWHVLMILTWFLFIWVFFFIDGGVWSNLI